MMKNFTTFLLLSFGSTALLATPSEEYMKQQMAELHKERQAFKDYKKEQMESFEAYKKAQMEAFRQYKKELGVYWEDPKLSTKKEWVAYSKDKKTRSDVNFEKNTITVETVAKSQKEALAKLRTTLAKVSVEDTRNAIEKDPLEERLAKIPKPKDLVDAKVDKKPILAPVIYKKPPTKKQIKKFVVSKVNEKTIVKKPSKKIEKSFVYRVVVKLPKDATYKRSKMYENEVRENASRQKLPLSLVFAIMHTESSFNPKATSHIPAYGLMQIVPHTAGIDSYKYLYRQKKIPSRRYLYNSKNNIRLGSAYLHILYYSYLKKIKDPQSRVYCAIAAYNTGAGNVAWAFTGTHNPSKAAKVVNGMTPQEVYDKLLRDLKYDEPKHYLRRVSKRMNIYHKIYGG